MMVNAVSAAADTDRSSVAAYRLLWLAVLFDVLAFGVGFASGAWLADRAWMVIADPRRGRVLAFVTVAGLCAPAITGILDLYRRAHTP